MKFHYRACLIVLIASFSVGLFMSVAALDSQDAAKYVCPPCGCGSDNTDFDKAGNCTSCGMTLVKKGTPAAMPVQHRLTDRKRAAILLFDGVQIIDFTGPYEVFGQAGLEVFTVAVSANQITTAMGMQVAPHYTLENAPRADVIIIPGGGVTLTQENPQVIKWIQEQSKDAESVLSVCNGAYILAKTGLLDGMTATTFYDLIDGLPAVAPKVKVVRDRRYVDNGKFITTAGISSGIDGSLYVVSKMFGKALAQMVALNMEYNWQPDSTYARASLADRHIRNIFGRRLRLNVPEGVQVKVLSTEGNPRSWEVRWQAQGATTAAEILKLLNDSLTAGAWKKEKSAKSETSAWRFTDEDGAEWSGAVTVQTKEANTFTVSLKVDRIKDKTSRNAADAADGIIIRDAWIQEMPPSQRLTAAYMVIENVSSKTTSLLSARSDIAGTVELHRAETDDKQMMRMRRLDRIPLPVGRTELTGDLHIMLIDLKQPVQEGDRVTLTLEFENSIRKTLLVPVRRRPAM
ncbi:MAG: copper chaperone PCu(A)C [Acidobacteriota bacterium]